MMISTIPTNEMISAILNSIDESIHAVDNNGMTIFYNQVAAENDGVSVEDVLGKHVLEAFPSSLQIYPIIQHITQ